MPGSNPASTGGQPNRRREHQTTSRHLERELHITKTELEENRVRTNAMINSLGEGLIVINDHGHITTANSYALTALGFSHEELEGAWYPKVIQAVDQHNRPIEPLARPITRALLSGQPVSDYTHYLKQDGSLIPVFETASPIRIKDNPTGVVVVFRDLTKERQLDVAKDEFVSLASHQLRTPATGVMMILSMLSKGDFGPLTPIQQKYLEKALRNNERQLQIIEDLLNAARVDAGKMQLDLEYVDIAPIVREAISDQATTLAAREQSVKLSVPASCRLLVDGPKLRMVLDNLISNASKYSHPGSKIEISLNNDGQQIIVSIRDHGVGMDDEGIAKLFTKFTRLDNELSASVGGTGLGLFLAKGIIELHGGTIKVDSTPGNGSVFSILLPTQGVRR